MKKFLLFFLPFFLWATDYDCIVIGSSPFGILEAIFQKKSGKEVLLLEKQARLGGAWKTIDICGIQNVDLGCHQIGANPKLKAFFESFVRCRIVSLKTPHLPFDKDPSSLGWYFSGGCHELIENLKGLLQEHKILVKTEESVQKISFDRKKAIAFVETDKRTYSAHKLFVSPHIQLSHNRGKPLRFPHVYLLVYDPSPIRFTYAHSLEGIAARAMNLTPFMKDLQEGMRLIAIQARKETSLQNPESFFCFLKEKKLLSPKATLLKAEAFVYESLRGDSRTLHQWGTNPLIEVLKTGHLQNLSMKFLKWKKIFPLDFLENAK